MAKAKAYLISNVEINWSCPKSLVGKNIPVSDKLHYSNGISDYLDTITQKNESVIEDSFYINEKLNDDESIEAYN